MLPQIRLSYLTRQFNAMRFPQGWELGNHSNYPAETMFKGLEQMFRAIQNEYCNSERVRTLVLVQKRQIPLSLFSHLVYTNLLT